VGPSGRTFTSLSAENEFLRHWEKTAADVRTHGTTRQQVTALFAAEQRVLLPSPPDLLPCFREGKRTAHRESYVELDKAYSTVPPEYTSDWVGAPGQRWGQIRLHVHLQPRKPDRSLGLGGGRGLLERQLDYWPKRAQERPCGLWSQGVLERKGPLGLRSIIGVIGLADQATELKEVSKTLT
jgi:hypothetical protein